VKTETTFDGFHKNIDDLYRINNVFISPNREMNMGMINAPAGPEFASRFPEIEQFARVRPYESQVKYETSHYIVDLTYTDSTFFDIFSFRLLSGDPARVLSAPRNIVLTESTAVRIMNDENPVGKIVSIQGEEYVVSGIVADPPLNSSLQFDILVPIDGLLKRSYSGWDGGLQCQTFVQLAGGTDIERLEREIMLYLEDVINRRYREHGYETLPYLQAVRKIHLDSDTEYDYTVKGSWKRVISFSLVGLLILFTACFNFVNISTALSMRRSKEVSVKKIFGSDRQGVVTGFLLESGLAIVTAMILSFLFARSALPYFNNMVGMNLTFDVMPTEGWIIAYLSIFFLCTFLASFYSAWYLSSIAPLTILRSVGSGKRRQLSRNILVTFQFTISISLIICCLVIYSQMRYIRDIDMGFSRENVIVINLGENSEKNIGSFKEEIKGISGVINASASAGGIPGISFTSNGYSVEGLENPILTNAVYIDPDYIATMKMDIIRGRDFRYGDADKFSLIVNETFVKAAGWEDPIGKSVNRNGIDYEVVGVIRDFFTSSLHSRIQPIILARYNEWGAYDNLIVSVSSSDISGLLERVKEVWKEYELDAPINYRMLEDMYSESYETELNLNLLFLVLAVMAIFISCLGLFGLATFTTQMRTREIGIRKVNGAMISNLLYRFSYELLRWIIVAFIIAAPVSFIIMSGWLENFAYRTAISLKLLLFSGIIALFIGFTAIIWSVWREASRNPVDTLRFE